MKILGIDPDTHTVGFAYGDKNKIYGVHCSNLPRRAVRDQAIIQLCDHAHNIVDEVIHGLAIDDDIDAIAIEGQQIYLRSGVNPQNIIYLAQAAGVIAAAVRERFKEVPLIMPLPQKWKGTAPKKTKQKKVLDHYGWEYVDNRNTIFPVSGTEELIQLAEIQSGHWTHIIDAIGIVLWASKRIEIGLPLR